MLDLAKPALDVGLFTEDWDAMKAFYLDEVGLPYEEPLPVGGGTMQHRLGLPGSVLKVNDSHRRLEDVPTGYRGLVIATEAADGGPRHLRDPDGLPVDLVAAGTDGVTNIGVRMVVRQAAVHDRFLVEAMGASRLAPRAYRIGTTVLFVEEDGSIPPAGGLAARGFHYLTVQVRYVVVAHHAIVARGAAEAAGPRRLGDVAAISMIRDPDGNWIEVSQRASLVGRLPEHL